MAILEISVIPVGTPSASISSYVTDACRVVEGYGLPYQVTPTATVIEGSVDQLLKVAQEMHHIPFRNGVERVVTSITIDDRHDKALDLEHQVQVVENQLQ